MSEERRYDKEEDRAKDKKTPDNPNHPSDYAHEKARRDAAEREQERPTQPIKK